MEKKIKDNETTKDSLGITILRIGLSIVFLYFGIRQLINPIGFIGWLPKEAALIPLAPKTLIILNGSLELFLGTLLLIGLYTRISALILGLHLLGITYTIGFTEIGIRDLGLSIATLSLVFMSPGRFSLGNYIKKSVQT